MMKTKRQYPYWLALCFAMVSTFSLDAACAWQGPSSIDQAAWDIAANWSCGRVPTVNDDADFPSGGIYTFTGDITTPSRIRNYGPVTISAGVSLSAMKLAVFADLTNNGNISFNGTNKTGYRITVHDPATLTNAATGTINVEDSAKNGIRVTSFSAMVNEGEVTLIVPADKTAIWVEVNGSYSGSGKMNIVSGGTICEGDCALLLPVELTDFKAVPKGRMNQLLWVTATEKNTRQFRLEFKGESNQSWREIGQVTAAGNSVVENQYSFQHGQPQRLSYYRLRMEDWDGSFEYSPVVSIVNQKLEEAGKVDLFPTLAGEVIYLETQDNDLIVNELHVFSIQGYLVKNIVFPEWENGRMEIPVSDLAPGAYFMRLDGGAAKRFFVAR